LCVVFVFVVLSREWSIDEAQILLAEKFDELKVLVRPACSGTLQNANAVPVEFDSMHSVLLTKYLTKPSLVGTSLFLPWVCATHTSQHAYGHGYGAPDHTEYTTIDGTAVFLDGREIDSLVLFSGGHYGPGGGPGPRSKQSIVLTVRKQYLQYYKTCEEAEKIAAALPPRPEAIVTRTTYCGN
jgi:hypothetical protein